MNTLLPSRSRTLAVRCPGAAARPSFARNISRGWCCKAFSYQDQAADPQPDSQDQPVSKVVQPRLTKIKDWEMLEMRLGAKLDKAVAELGGKLDMAEAKLDKAEAQLGGKLDRTEFRLWFFCLVALLFGMGVKEVIPLLKLL